MLIGYARVSDKTQNTDRQVEQFIELGLDPNSKPKQIYIDKQSGKDFNRPEYMRMLEAVRAGDTIIITSLDRLGRNYEEIGKQFKQITELGVFINVLDMPILNTDQKGDLTSKFISDMVLMILSYIAEQERNRIKTTQKQGIKSAKAKGVKFGRPKVSKEKIDLAKYYMNLGYSTAKACNKAQLNRKTYYNQN